MLNIRRILHPTDFSANSRQAFEVACGFAENYDARLLVIGILERPGIGALAGFGGELAHARGDMQQGLDKLRPTASANISIERRVIEGNSVAGEILRVAEEEHCDLIVMGAHDRTGIERLAFGSVAEEVAYKAPCPVVPIRDSSRLLAQSTVAYDQRESNGCISGRR